MQYHEYNGWANRATWLVDLWIDNEESTYHAKLDWLRRCRRYEIPIDSTSVLMFVNDLMACRQLKGLADDLAPMGSQDPEDYGHRWKDIAWCEIAESWKAEIEENEEVAG